MEDVVQGEGQECSTEHNIELERQTREDLQCTGEKHPGAYFQERVDRDGATLVTVT